MDDIAYDYVANTCFNGMGEISPDFASKPEIYRIKLGKRDNRHLFLIKNKCVN